MITVRDCLVQVDGASVGSGFLAAPGFVLTCAHVAGKETSSVLVYWQGTELAGRVLAASQPPDVPYALWPFPDLAIIELTAAPPGHPCVWLDDRLPASGSNLMVHGFSTKLRSVPEEISGRFVYNGDQVFHGGSMLRLTDSEVAAGMSGGPVLNEASGGVCAVVKATRMEDTDMGGFGTPVGALRRLRADVYRRFIRAHDRFHATERWHSDAPEGSGVPRAEERALFAILASAPTPENPITDFSALVSALTPSPATPMHDHRDVITELEAMAAPIDGVPRTLRHVAVLLRRFDGELKVTLMEWLHAAAGRLGLGPDARAHLASLRPRETAGSVLIQLRPSSRDHTLLSVSLWRYHSADEITPVDLPNHDPLPLAEALDLVQTHLPAQLALLSDRCDTVMIELIVPRELMDERFEDWRLWPTRSWSSLGRKHPVVVRDLERFEDPQLHASWRRRWKRLCADVPMTLVCNSIGAQHERLEGWIEANPDAAALILSGSPQHTGSDAALDVAITSGIPMIAWRRTDAADCPAVHSPACRSALFSPCLCADDPAHARCPAAALLDGLEATRAANWPEEIRRLRAECAAQPGGHYAEGLILLWDDPTRTLPDATLQHASERYQPL
ncbi:trypsin-like peptidase domain-containing protein [Streptosporangiaceae bacterium NEAU-GS5]|nr:trypsin-like peptidase domain-containing protein [Streptosporangiaceae bacterium NEAU-GS5]